MVVSVALGMFDGLHLGHMAVINAMPEGKRAVFTFSVGDARPGSKSGKKLLSRSLRDSLLKAAGIDFIYEPKFEDIRDMSPREFADGVLKARLNAAKVYCGENFRFGKGAAASATDLALLLPTEIIPTVTLNGENVSTTRIRGCVEAGDMQTAANLLGRPYAIDFPVEHGNRIGRTLNLPTINQAYPEDFALPRFGVYASAATIDGVRYKSVTNVGTKPTVGPGPTVGGTRILAETYITGFSGDLYGRNIPVELLRFIRPERKFDSLDRLKAQIRQDLHDAMIS